MHSIGLIRLPPESIKYEATSVANLISEVMKPDNLISKLFISLAIPVSYTHLTLPTKA